MKFEMKCGILLFLSYLVIKSNASPPSPTPALLTKEVTVNVITRKWAHLLNDKFLSFTLQPQIALEFQDYRPATMNMFKALSPAFLRLGGQEINHVTFLTDGINSHYTITDEQWKRLNKFSDKTKLDLIICVNPMERLHGVWQSRGALEFIDASDKLGYNLHWELGYELQRLHNSSEPLSGNELGRDVVRLRKILDSFPRYSKSVIIGPDVIDSSSPEDMQFIKEFVNESGDALSALTWHPKFSEVNRTKEDVINTLSQIHHKLDTIIWPRDPTKPPTVKQPNKKEVWLSESSADDYEGDFSDALTWTKRLGSAAALGFPVFMKQISSSSVTRPTPDFWVSVLYKSLVGRAVLETKLMMGEKNTSQTFAHCTEMSPNNVIDEDYQYEQGAVTLFGLNLGTEEIKLNIKGNTKDESVHAYILTAENKNNLAETYMNGQLLTLSPTGELPILSPKIKNATRNVAVDIPPQSVYFLVLPEMKTKICTSYPVTQRNEIKENIEHHKQIEPIVNAIVTQDFSTKKDDNKKELYVRFGPKKHKMEVEDLGNKAENENLMNLITVTPESESIDEKELHRLSKSISEMDLDNPVKSKTLKLSNSIKGIKNLRKDSGKGSTLNDDVVKEKELLDPIFNTKFILFSDDDWMSNFSHAKKAVEAAKKIIEAFDEAEMMKKHHESQQESVLQVENDKYHVQYGKDSLRKKKFAVLTASILEKENNTNNTNGIPTDKESMVNGNTIEDINHDPNTVANIDLMENISHGRLKRETMDAKHFETASNLYLHKQSVSKEYDKDFKNKIIKGKTDGMDTIKISEKEEDKEDDSSYSDDQSYHPGEFYEYQNMPKNHVNHKPCGFEDLCEAELSAQNENEQVNPSNSEKEVSSMSVVSDNCKCKNDEIIKEGVEKELKNYYENAKKTVSEFDDDENNEEKTYDVYYKNNGKTGKNRKKRKAGDELNLKNQLILNNKKKLDHSKEMLTVHVRKPKSITKIEPRKTPGIKSKLSSTSKLVPRKEKLGKSITPSLNTKHLNKREVMTKLSDSKIQSALIEEDLLDKMINKVKNHPILGDTDESTNVNKNDEEKHEETNIPIIVNSVPINSLPDKNTKEIDSEIEKLDLKHKDTNDQSRTVGKNEDVTSEAKNKIQKDFLQDQQKMQDEGIQEMKKGKLLGELLGLSKGENDEENEWNEGKLDNENKELSKDKNDEEKMKWNESIQEQNNKNQKKENDDMMKGNQSEKFLGNVPQENKHSHGEVDHNTALESEVGTLLSEEHKADSAPLDGENTKLKDGFQRSSNLDSNSFDKKLKDVTMSEDAQSERNGYEEEDQIGTKDIDIVCGRTKHFGTFCIGSERKSDDINEENSSASSLSKLTPMSIFNKVGGPSEMHQNNMGLESNSALMNNILQTELNKQSEGEPVLVHRREVTNDQLDDNTNAQDKEDWNEYLQEGTPTCKASRSAPYIEDFEELISQMRNLEKDSDNVRNRRLIHFTVPAVNVNHDKLTINDINEERPIRNSEKNLGDASPDRSHDNHFKENEDNIRNGANDNYNKGLKFKQYYEEDIKPSRQLKRTLLPSRRENGYNQHYKTHFGEPIDKDTYYDNLERNSRYRNRDDTEEEYYLNDNYKETDGELRSTGYHQRKEADYEADRYGSELDERDIYSQRANSHLRNSHSHLPEGMYGETSQWNEKRLPGDVYRELEGSETQIQRRQPYFVKSKPVPIIPAVMTSPDMFKPKFTKIGPHRNRRSIVPAFHNFQNDINNMMKNEMIQLEPFNYERKLQPRSPNIKKYYPIETGPSSLVHHDSPGTNHMNKIVKMTHYRKRSIPESENKESVNQNVQDERFTANRLIRNSNVNSDGINDKFDNPLLTDKGEFVQVFANKLGDLAKIYMAKENSKGYNIKDTDIGDLKFLTSFNEKYKPEVIVNELDKNGLNAATELKQSVEEKENHSSELTDKIEHKNSLPNANMANNDITKMIAKAILLPMNNNAPLNQINQNTFSYVVNQMKGFIQFVLQAIGQL